VILVVEEVERAQGRPFFAGGPPFDYALAASRSVLYFAVIDVAVDPGTVAALIGLVG